MTKHNRVEICRLEKFMDLLNSMAADGYDVHSWHMFMQPADSDPRVRINECMVAAVFQSGQAERGQ